MSADAWKVCPRCKANMDLGIHGTDFREDYEIGMEEDGSGLIYVIYRGECQRCGLLITFDIKDMVKTMAVVEAAMAWEADSDRGSSVLLDALDALDAPPDPEPANEPTGPTVLRPWSGIPAGWFVKAPSGTWYEVTATRRDWGLQQVTLKDGGTFPRDPGQRVPCRRGTKVTQAADALDVLGEGAEVLEDGL